MAEDEVIDLDDLIETDVVMPVIEVKPAVTAPVVVKDPKTPRGIAVEDVETVIEHAEAYFGEDLKALTPLQQLVIVGFLRTNNPSLACAMAGASIRQHKKWLMEDEAYREFFTAAHDAIGDTLESTSVAEALRTKDPKLLLGLLKGYKKEKYGAIKGDSKETQPTSWADLAKKMTE